MVWRGPIDRRMPSSSSGRTSSGANVDYLFVDMPPGTGDVPLTVFQTIPLDGVVIVASPQELVAMIVAEGGQHGRV